MDFGSAKGKSNEKIYVKLDFDTNKANFVVPECLWSIFGNIYLDKIHTNKLLY